ncbi:hypothetical protein AKJ38_02180 [candidate division MSBL1 archaeon SCGC-AAA259I14]|uniref:DUF447 domain-containing protein n=2 Tax=candidate division MSBL1 TaxID=215777 RepID=A0A133URY1_9EURY|nr:hypothetical protein AKJ38_02180 [candidate division MSBL1 archaeon SCGC-AAA259I14]
MTILQKIGLDSKSPAETILTTYNQNETPHMSAIGIQTVNEDKIKMKLYTGTKTLQNIQNKKAATINIVNNAVFLSKQGLPEIFSRKIKSSDFAKAKNVNSPYLKQADAIIEFKVEKTIEKTVSDRIGKSNITEVIGSVKNMEVKNSYPHPFKRAEFYLIESAILATKAIESKKRQKEKLAHEYVEKIEIFKNKCEKIAPESRELKTISEILDYFE